MASNDSLVFTVRVAWWLRLYLATYFFICRLFDIEPRIDRVGKLVSFGLRVTACNMQVSPGETAPEERKAA